MLTDEYVITFRF